MRDSSVRERSTTPVPASTRMSLSSSIDVVRRCRPPIPPLQPRIRSFIVPGPRLFLVEHGYAIAFGRRRIAAPAGGLLRIQVVERTIRIHAVEIEQVHIYLIPLTGAIQAERLLPQFYFIASLLVVFDVSPDGFVYRKRFVLPFHLDLVDLLERDFGHKAFRSLTHQASDAVVLGPALEARSDVHGVSHDRICAPDRRPHVPDPNLARVDTNTDLELRPAALPESLIHGRT